MSGDGDGDGDDDDDVGRAVVVVVVVALASEAVAVVSVTTVADIPVVVYTVVDDFLSDGLPSPSMPPASPLPSISSSPGTVHGPGLRTSGNPIAFQIASPSSKPTCPSTSVKP